MIDNKSYGYTDEFSDIIHTERFINAAELSELFFSAPKWITILMKFRNVMMRPFGLKKKEIYRIWYTINSGILQRENLMIIQRNKYTYWNLKSRGKMIKS